MGLATLVLSNFGQLTLQRKVKIREDACTGS